MGLHFFILMKELIAEIFCGKSLFPITLEDDAGSLYEKIKDLASEAIREILPQLKQQTAPRMPQNHDLASYWGKRGEKDGEIQWSGSTLTAFNLIRALTHPYVGAHTFWDGEKVLIWKAQIPEGQIQADVVNLPPGSVFQVREFGFDVRTGDGFLTVIDYDVPVGNKIDTYTRLGV